VDIRKLAPDDLALGGPLGIEAFGPRPVGSPVQLPPTELPPGRHTWGAFEGDRLVAKVVALEIASWFGGVSIPTCGIAGVAVSAEHRGGGLLSDVFAPLLDEAAGRGEVLSTLYPTANGIYRSFGYELISSYDTVEIATSELTRVRPATATRTRRASVSDVPAIREVYAGWAAAQNGPLNRTGPHFAEVDEQWLAEVTAATLAVDADDRIVGYAAWDRSGGYGAEGRLEIRDLIALTSDGYRALWSLAATFSSVTTTVRLTTSGHDPARLVLPTSTWNVVGRHPYMLRVSDVAGAFSTLGPAVPGLAASVDFAVVGDRFGASDGSYRLTLGDGAGTCERIADAQDVPTFTTQGIALAFAGAQSCANLRLTDHLSGPTTYDAVLDAVLGGRPLHVRDYF